MSWQERFRQTEDSNQREMSRQILAVSKPYHDALVSVASDLLRTGKATRVVETVNHWVPWQLPKLQGRQTDNYMARLSGYSAGPGNKAAKFELSTRFAVREKDLSLGSFTVVIIGSGSWSSPVQLDLSFGWGSIRQANLSWKDFYPDTCLYLLDDALGDLIKKFYFCTRTAEGVNWGKFFITGSHKAAEYDYPTSVTTYSISGSSIRLDLGPSPKIELTQDILSQEKFSERYIKGGYTKFGGSRKNLLYIYDPASSKFLAYIEGPGGANNPQVYNGETVVREMAGWPQKTTKPPVEEMEVEEFLAIYRSMLALIPMRIRVEGTHRSSSVHARTIVSPEQNKEFKEQFADVQSPFGVLGISETATTDEIRKAYRQQISACHPDLIRGILEKAGVEPNDPRRRYFEQAAGERTRKINVAFSELRRRGRV